MSRKKPLEVIAGATDHPLVIGDIEIPCYVLEDETRVLVQRGMAMVNRSLPNRNEQTASKDGDGE